MEDDQTVSDRTLILRARSGEDQAEEQLAVRYSRLVRMCARPYFLVGGDREDLIQEGMLGLLSAIRKYDPDAGVSFQVYAEQCIRNRLLTAIESASRLKHTPLNDGVSYELLSREHPHSLESVDSFARGTEEQVLARVRQEEILQSRAKQLSRYERDVLDLFLQGWSYKEIAARMKKSEKSIDNAIQRIRKKLAET